MSSKKLINYVPLAAVLLGFTVFANDVSAAQENKAEKVLENISKEGRMAMQELRLARVAIFDGQLKQAKEMLNQSKKYLSTVEKQLPELVVTVKTEEKIGGKTVNNEKATMTKDLVPIDAGLVVAEDFVATPEKNEKIKKANEHLKNHETSKAVEVLREADIGLSVSRVLMPVKDTMKHVDKAVELFGEHKYYEANLALKAAEDGLIVDSVLLYEPVIAPKPVVAPKK
jgi:hypothetical protein